MEVDDELEAVRAIYLDDCRIFERWPPRVEFLLRPRTADDISQQFVEIVLAVTATEQYPQSLPSVELRVAKGLDDTRQAELLSLIQEEMFKLLDGPMLVTIAETAVDFVTGNNYPEGDCCFCLLPLVDESTDTASHVMKLASCFHCFHSNCFARWLTSSSGCDMVKSCPVCRAVISDVDRLVAGDFLITLDEHEHVVVPQDLIQKEIYRQKQYEEHFMQQRARGGIITES